MVCTRKKRSQQIALILTLKDKVTNPFNHEKQYLSWGKKDKKNTMLLAKSQRNCTGSSAKASSFPTIITSFKPNSPGDGATGYDLIFHCRVMSCDCHVTHAM